MVMVALAKRKGEGDFGMKKRLVILIFVSILLGLSYYPIMSAEKSDQISIIRSLYQQTKDKISKGELIETKIDIVANTKVSDEIGGMLDSAGPIYCFYWTPKEGTLVFASQYQAHGSLLKETEYLFYDNGEPAFMFQKTSSVGNKYSSEIRYYFKNNTLIRCIEDGLVFEGKMISPQILEYGKQVLEKMEAVKLTFDAIMHLD